jgi:hypothetical protein
LHTIGPEIRGFAVLKMPPEVFTFTIEINCGNAGLKRKFLGWVRRSRIGKALPFGEND